MSRLSVWHAPQTCVSWCGGMARLAAANHLIWTADLAAGADGEFTCSDSLAAVWTARCGVASLAVVSLGRGGVAWKALSS